MREGDQGLLCKQGPVMFQLSIKVEWVTTKPYRYDLKLTPYDHTVEVTDSRD